MKTRLNKQQCFTTRRWFTKWWNGVAKSTVAQLTKHVPTRWPSTKPNKCSKCSASVAKMVATRLLRATSCLNWPVPSNRWVGSLPIQIQPIHLRWCPTIQSVTIWHLKLLPFANRLLCKKNRKLNKN